MSVPSKTNWRNMPEPWALICKAAEHIKAAYDPGDDSDDPGRCDLQPLQDGLTAALMTLEGAEDTPAGNRDTDPVNAVIVLLRASQDVLQRLSGDLPGAVAPTTEGKKIAAKKGDGRKKGTTKNPEPYWAD
jgi:hypothetical protein